MLSSVDEETWLIQAYQFMFLRCNIALLLSKMSALLSGDSGVACFECDVECRNNGIVLILEEKLLRTWISTEQ